MKRLWPTALLLLVGVVPNWLHRAGQCRAATWTGENGAFRPQARQQASTQPEPGEVRINEIDGGEMVWVPEGNFLMGTSPEEFKQQWQRYGLKGRDRASARENESPAHEVFLPGYWMYRHEVTVGQYRRFCQATGYRMPGQPNWDWQEHHPMVWVSWGDAVKYCQWAGGHLPTEAQWEYAARGGSTGMDDKPRYAFVWGDEVPKGQNGYGNLNAREIEGYSDDYAGVAPVGSFSANGYELKDMEGNVAEWCIDVYDKKVYRKCHDAGVVSNPVHSFPGAASLLQGSIRHVVRGGSYADSTPLLHSRVAFRLGVDGFGFSNVGFRCVVPRGTFNMYFDPPTGKLVSAPTPPIWPSSAP